MHKQTIKMADGQSVEFRIDRHPAMKYVHGVPVQVVKDQLQVSVGGVRVAYCGTQPDRTLNFIRHYDVQFATIVAAFVTAKIGEPSQLAMPPNSDGAARDDDSEPIIWTPDE